MSCNKGWNESRDVVKSIFDIKHFTPFLQLLPSLKTASKRKTQNNSRTFLSRTLTHTLCKEECVASRKCHLQLKSGLLAERGVAAASLVALLWCNPCEIERGAERERGRVNGGQLKAPPTDLAQLDDTQTPGGREGTQIISHNFNIKRLSKGQTTL